MNEDIGEFWRTKFAELQKINMRAGGRERLTIENAGQLFDTFKSAHKDFECSLTISDSAADWEINLSSELKIRLFVQSQTKGSIVQRTEAGFVKLGDAKFFSNPIPEIDFFLSHFEEYQKELADWLIQRQKFAKMQKITGEMIKALLTKKLAGKNIVWYVEPKGQNFALITENKGERLEYPISFTNFAADINNLNF